MLLGEFLKNFKDSLYLKTRDYKPKGETKDHEVIINIHLGAGGTVVKKKELLPPQESPETTSNTEGTSYKGYTIKQEDDGTFNIFSVGGVLIGTVSSLEEAMNKINGISVGEEK